MAFGCFSTVKLLQKSNSGQASVGNQSISTGVVATTVLGCPENPTDRATVSDKVLATLVLTTTGR
jgi:hypothetical protein